VKGNTTWTCTDGTSNSNYKFDEPEPDRSQCKQIYWITGVKNDILSGDKPAKDILKNIMLNIQRLEKEEDMSFTSDDLTGLINILSLLNNLQFDQLMCDNSTSNSCTYPLTGADKLYGDDAYYVASFIFNRVEAWKNIVDDEDRFRNSSSLIAQIEKIGALTLTELKLKELNDNFCPKIYQLYTFNLLNVTLLVELVQHKKNSNEDMIFRDSSGDWQITVPHKHLPSCASAVGSVLSNLAFEETKQFPRYPSEAELKNADNKGQNFPNGLYPIVVDFSVILNAPLVTNDEDRVVLDFFHEEKVIEP